MNEVKDYIYKFGSRAVEQWSKEQSASLTPGRVDNYLSVISGYSAVLEEEFANLEMQRVRDFVLMKPQFKTNAETEMNWLATAEGQRYLKLKGLIKGTDKIIRACRDRLRRFENQAKNIY